MSSSGTSMSSRLATMTGDRQWTLPVGWCPARDRHHPGLPRHVCWRATDAPLQVLPLVSLASPSGCRSAPAALRDASTPAYVQRWSALPSQHRHDFLHAHILAQFRGLRADPESRAHPVACCWQAGGLSGIHERLVEERCLAINASISPQQQGPEVCCKRRKPPCKRPAFCNPTHTEPFPQMQHVVYGP